MKTVCVVGIWHLGIVNTVGFAKRGYRVCGIEFDKSKAKSLQKGIPPLFEPGIKEALHKYIKSKRIYFSHDPGAVEEAHYVIIAYDSPVNQRDEVDITPVVKAAKTIAPHLQSKSPVVITSQIPLGTSEKVEKIIRQINPDWTSGVVYMPENLRLGSALERFLKPDMIVFGANTSHAARAARTLYEPFSAKKIYMDLRSAEMVKHALNTFLATSITFGNEIAHLSDLLGADALRVATALKWDTRIAKAPILPGLGFSGGTLARDVQQLRKFAKIKKYKATLLNSIFTINESTFNYIVNKLKKHLGTLEGKIIGILGLTYKPGTSTMRHSPAIKIIKKLTIEGSRCLAYDPKADETELKRYKRLVRRMNNLSQLAKESDALVLVTEWPRFREVDYNKLAPLMKKPLLIDAKNFLDPSQMTKAGVEYVGYGR